MKVVFIGTSHGAPEPHQRCSCIMIEINSQLYLIDMGTCVIEALCDRGISANAIKGVFITHMHNDHTNGLFQFVELLRWRYKEARPIIYLPNLAAADVINQWLSIVSMRRDTPPVEYQETKPGVIYDDGTLMVTAIPTQHCANSYAYLLEAEGKSVLFTGDLLRPGIDFPAVAKERTLDLLVCEGAHFEATEYLPVFEQCDIRQICVTHYYNPHIISVLQLKQELIQRGIPTTIATDGCEITI